MLLCEDMSHFPSTLVMNILCHALCAQGFFQEWRSWRVSSPHCTEYYQIALQSGCKSWSGHQQAVSGGSYSPHTHTNTWQKVEIWIITNLMGVTWYLIISTCASLSASKVNNPVYTASCTYLLLIHIFCQFFKWVHNFYSFPSISFMY